MPNTVSCDRKFRRIQNLHISQTAVLDDNIAKLFRRIQNLHISQTSNRDLEWKF